MTDASGTTTYTYGYLGRLVSKATPEGTLNYTYDAAGHVASITSSNANGASASYTYDELNRLSTVTDNRLSGQNTTTYAYDTANNVVTVTYPNGVQSTLNYDTLNRLTSLVTPTTGYLYQLGPTGNRTNVTENTGRSINWSYDGIYRLTNESISNDPSKVNGSVSYGLDPVGNRLSASSSVSGVNSGSYTYNSDDQLSTEVYDGDGNAISAGGKIFTYNSDNRLTSANGGAVSIVYDGDGNRVSETVNGVTTKYLVEDDVNPTGHTQVMDEIVNGAVQRTYAYGYQRIDEDQVVNNAWTPSFYGYDGMGSVRQLTNSAGATTDTYEYDAFGNEIASTGTTPNNYLYRGEQYDPSLGLYYLRARWYNPLTGRFLSRDPAHGHIAVPRTLHKYAYAGDDPVDRVDPGGREDLEEEGEIDLNVPESAVEGEEYTAREASCILYTAASLVQLVDSSPELGLLFTVLEINEAECDAEGERPGAHEPEPGEPEPEPEPEPGCCFAAGTPVHTNHGDVPVENIKIDDEVLSRNRATGKVEYEPVTALTPLHKDNLLEMRIEGERDPLRPAADHPFLVRRGDASSGDWILAGQMRVGDLVETIQGNWRRVTAITPVSQEQTVYNFTVANDHDYFVGQTGFLVHNQTCDRCGTDLHHIVPQTAEGVEDARGVLAAAGIGIHDPRNLVPLPRCFHQRLHTDVYYGTVNEAFVNAGPNNAAALLGELSDFLTNLADECGCPFEP
jgi:RHS repeat-associated protein